MKPTPHGYDYITTHVDDFMVAAKDLSTYTKQLNAVFSLKSESTPNYFLRNNYRLRDNGLWAISAKKCIESALSKIEDIYSTIALVLFLVVEQDHPELDASPFLNTLGYCDF